MTENSSTKKGGCCNWDNLVRISRSANVLDRRFPEDAVNAPEFYDDKIDTIASIVYWVIMFLGTLFSLFQEFSAPENQCVMPAEDPNNCGAGVRGETKGMHAHLLSAFATIGGLSALVQGFIRSIANWVKKRARKTVPKA